MIAYSTALNPYLNIFHLADLIFNLRFYRTLNFILSKCKNPKKNKRPIGHIIHLKNTSNFDLSKKLSLLNCCRSLPLWLLYKCHTNAIQMYTTHWEKKKYTKYTRTYLVPRTIVTRAWGFGSCVKQRCDVCLSISLLAIQPWLFKITRFVWLLS